METEKMNIESRLTALQQKKYALQKLHEKKQKLLESPLEEGFREFGANLTIGAFFKRFAVFEGEIAQAEIEFHELEEKVEKELFKALDTLKEMEPGFLFKVTALAHKVFSQKEASIEQDALIEECRSRLYDGAKKFNRFERDVRIGVVSWNSEKNAMEMELIGCDYNHAFSEARTFGLIQLAVTEVPCKLDAYPSHCQKNCKEADDHKSQRCLVTITSADRFTLLAAPPAESTE